MLRAHDTATRQLSEVSEIVEGRLVAAQQELTEEMKRLQISLYVFGDEFTGDSIDEVVKSVDRINRPDRSGERRVRIHAVGFPVMFALAGTDQHTGVRFATLMRILCERNGGAFVALNRNHP